MCNTTRPAARERGGIRLTLKCVCVGVDNLNTNYRLIATKTAEFQAFVKIAGLIMYLSTALQGHPDRY